MKKKMTPYILLVPQLILGVVFIIGLGTGIIQSLGVIPAFWVNGTDAEIL